MTARFSVVRQSAVSERTMELVRKRYMSPSDVWGYSWGFDALNQKTGGIHAKEDSGTNELTILGARSNVGKSSFAQTVSVNLAMQFAEEYPGLQVRVISLEMSPAALYRRAVGQLAGVRLWNMMTGRLTPDELRRLEKADRKLSKLPISYIEGSHDIGAIEEFIAREDTKTGQKCGYFVLDHIQIIPSTDANRTGNHTWALGNISRQLHHIAREHCPGLVLAQLNRESLKRKDATPNASDIAQSDKILQDADLVLLLHRPELFEDTPNDSDGEELALCIIEKQREGPAGIKLPMGFDKKTAMWTNLPEESVDE